jgi:hypothetical protein
MLAMIGAPATAPRWAAPPSPAGNSCGEIAILFKQLEPESMGVTA